MIDFVIPAKAGIQKRERQRNRRRCTDSNVGTCDRSNYLLPAPGVSCSLLIAVLVTLLFHACGGGSTVDIEGDITAIGSPSPASISIPDIAGMKNLAFVLTSYPPRGVFIFHLDFLEPPLPFDSYDFNKALQGLPEDLVISRENLAFITTNNTVEGVWAFNPNPLDQDSFEIFSSYIYTGKEFPLPPGKEAKDSQGNIVYSIRPKFTSGVAMSQGKVYISTSNYIQTGPNPVCAPGTVLITDFDDTTYPPHFSDSAVPGIIITSDFNPTEITPFGDRIILVTNTGVLAIRNNKGVPLSEGSVDVVDTDKDCIVAKYPLGLGSPSFKKIAITPDNTRGYLGSAAYNHVYELDLRGLEQYLGTCPEGDPPVLYDKILRGLLNPPIRATLDPAGTPNLVPQTVVNYSGTQAYATGYNSGTLAILEIEKVPGRPSPEKPLQVIQVTDPMPTQNEAGPGPLAVRPGIPGTDFSGPDVYVVTGLPIGELRGLYIY